MNVYEKFIIYSTANILLIQFFQAAYKIIRTNFRSPNICFKVNKMRLFALSAEGIYLKHSNERES